MKDITSLTKNDKLLVVQYFINKHTCSTGFYLKSIIHQPLIIGLLIIIYGAVNNFNFFEIDGTVIKTINEFFDTVLIFGGISFLAIGLFNLLIGQIAFKLYLENESMLKDKNIDISKYKSDEVYNEIVVPMINEGVDIYRLNGTVLRLFK